jgi:thioesterase domain-containing protein/acyl carrier protein
MMRSAIAAPSNSPTLSRLTAIWERVLQRSPIEINDNFFECGGDSLLALHVFMEITRETGRELPITTIYDAPTIAALAALLDGAPATPFSPLVLAKPGLGVPPFFLVHGMGGTVMELTLLGKLIDYEGPVYAIQARGLDRAEPPIDNVDEMAAYYLREILEIQPHGPYLVGGYSFGGMVALTMAQRLTEASEKVALLAFLECYATPITWPLSVRLDVQARRAQHWLSWLLKAPLRDKIAFLRFHLRRLDRKAERRFGSPVRQWLSPEDLTVPADIQAVQDGIVDALAKYRLSFYPGKISFIQPTKTVHIFPRNPKSVWGRYAEEIEIRPTPGDHRTQLEEPYVAGLASVLAQCLKEELSGPTDVRACSSRAHAKWVAQ